ncbi:MAG TPA: hypothetical protein VMY16_08170 [Ilumatobacteraceae bacterium]|nr:hypothetical protein [Ilumatobacteraceae bacterium]
MIRHLTNRRLLVSLAAATLVFAACGSDDDSSSDTTAPTEDATDETTVTEAAETTDDMTEETAPPETEAPAAMFEGDLVGMFSIDDAVCDAADVTGSYFRMLQPDGKYILNADSACVDVTYSGMTAGTDGGLLTGGYQESPDPAFDEAGNATAGAIFAPVPFFGAAFAGATDSAEAMPMLTATDGVLTGDLSAFTAYFGGGSFNQGAPKPDGTGDAPIGTIDPETGAYVIDWTSLISGGSFDGFTGVWHLEGTFTTNS